MKKNKRKRKISIVTGSRSEYGLLYWLIKDLFDDDGIDLSLVVTGMHLSNEYGNTVLEIEKDGFKIDEKIEVLLSSDTGTSISKSMALCLIGFSEYLNRKSPDIVVVMGDRFEILPCAIASKFLNIPLVHLSGGELSFGSLDDTIRHSITKFANLHLVSAEEHRKRVIQMGENPKHVYNVGEPGLDAINRTILLNKQELEKSLGIKFGELNFIMTYHPQTNNSDLKKIKQDIDLTLSALDEFKKATIICTYPNADLGNNIIVERLKLYQSKNKNRFFLFKSLGHIRYLSVVKQCNIVIGNSSSGLVEVPMLKIPTVNIGDRQKGRLTCKSVINCKLDKSEIVESINQALSPSHCKITLSTISPYGDGKSSGKIIKILKNIELKSIKSKEFFDIKC